jgi:hypothetical protein
MNMRFRYHHLQYIQRSIGLGSKPLKGRPVQLLEKGLTQMEYGMTSAERGRQLGVSTSAIANILKRRGEGLSI